MQLFSKLFQAFEAEGESLFVCGGAVRDLELARRWDVEAPMRFTLHTEYFWEDVEKGHKDVDFATSALPEKTMEILRKHKLKVIPIGLEFGTIQTIVEGIKVEITTFRSDESYKKGSRKPDVQFGKSLEQDLGRRDFTINAMAMDKDGKIIDPFNGKEDLLCDTIRTPLDPIISFGDDPLRMLRAARFASRLGFIVADETQEAMSEMRKEINTVSAERIFDEMSKILMTATPSVGLNLLVDTGVLAEFFPELQKVVDFKQNQGKWHSKLVWPHTMQVVENTPKRLNVRWAALYHDVAKPQTYSESETGVHFYGHDWKGALVWEQAARRMKTSKDFENNVSMLVREHLSPALLSSEGPNQVSNASVRRFVKRIGEANLEDLFDLSMADITSHNPTVVKEKRDNLLAFKKRIQNVLAEGSIEKLKLPTGLGSVLMEKLSLKPGKQLGDLMKNLTQKLVDGDLNLESDFVEEARKLL